MADGFKIKTKKPFKITKEHLSGRNIYKVTVRLPKSEALGAKKICVIGDFTNWENYGYFMEKQKNGDFIKTFYLLANKNHYLVEAIGRLGFKIPTLVLSGSVDGEIR